jgi:uncharacterized protein YndB with AHSA1/START domain
VIEPLRIGFEVACPPEHAFTTWTERLSAWWPRDHTTTGGTMELEPRVGGRVFERADDGTEIPWGEVTIWEPPHRLGYLWHMRTERENATDVEITFVPRDDGTTRVEIEHRGWDRLGPEWRARNERGWTTLIPYYEEAL